MGSKPVTPPDTPVSSMGLATSSFDACNQSNPVARSWQVECPYTPPNSRISTPLASSTVRRITTVRSTGQSPPSNLASNPCGDRNDLILSELEAAVSNYPTARLYLDSPVVQHARLVRSGQPRFLRPPCCYASLWSAAPHSRYSRYSTFSPLSSHPITPQATPSYRGLQFCRPAEDKDLSDMRASTQFSTEALPAHSNPTMSALRTIFPQAPANLLDSLQATYLALNCISTLPVIYPSTPSEHSLPRSSTPSIRSLSSIAPKALATLGIERPHSSARGHSWLHVPPSAAEDPSTADQHTARLRERRENLQISLRILVRGLLGEIEGRRLTKRDESLVKAVGEVVRCGEQAMHPS